MRSLVSSAGRFGLSCKSDGVNRAGLGLLCTLTKYPPCIFHSTLRYVDDADVYSMLYGMSSSVDSVVFVSGVDGNVVV